MRAHSLCLFVTLLGNSFAIGQSAATLQTGTYIGAPATAHASGRCRKSISFALAEGGQPVPAIPRFAAKWFGKGKHVESYTDICLSQIPSSQTANYVVIFSTNTITFDGLTPIAHTYSSTFPASSEGLGSSSYGGTWSYSYKGTPPDTTSTIDLQKLDQVKRGLLLYTYNQQGHLVSHYIVDGDHSRENRLEQALADIQKDIVEKPGQKRITAPLSVYYVNCDVDSPGPSSLVAASEPPPTSPEARPASAPRPPPQGTLELVSTPSGADVYVDNKYLGKTPYIATVTPGEHEVLMRKQDFSSWSRDLQVAPGPKRINAYLEQKFLTLPSMPSTTAQPPAKLLPQNRPASSQGSQQQTAPLRTVQSQSSQFQPITLTSSTSQQK